MDPVEKDAIMKGLMVCIGEAINMNSDDSEKEDVVIGLSNLLLKATQLRTKRVKRLWVKTWRKTRAEHGSFTFLNKELLLSDEASYKNYLRVTKTQFTCLLNLVQQNIARSDTLLRDAIPAGEKLAMTLRFLASGETYTSLNYQTRLSVSTIAKTVPEVCEILYQQLKGTYLKFPNSVLEWEAIAKKFAIKWQFPNCLGAIDGKHINFRSLRRDGTFYHNYKGTNSIVLMALADAHCKFIFVDVGCNGRCNDAGVFLQSTLSTILKEEKGIPSSSVVGNGRRLPYVVIGDDAFPMQTHLMKPYPYHTNSEEKQVFNARLSRGRHVVEHAFGILANRFRVFLSPINLRAEKVQLIVLTCCALHNFLINSYNTYIERYDNSKPVSIGDSLDSTYNPRKGEAEVIRQEFMKYFTNEGKLDWQN